LITTKKGKAGPTRVDLNLQNGWGKVTRELHLMNTPQYLEMRHEAIANDGQATGPGDYDINGTWDTTRYTNWQKALIGGTAQYANLAGSVSGGNNNTQYLVSGTFNRQTTVFPGDFYDNKGAVHFNVNTVSANDKFHFTISGNYLIDNNHLPFSDLTSYAVSLAPDAPLLYNKDGSVNWASTSTGSSSFSSNPIASLSTTYQTKGNNLVSNANLMYQVLRGIALKCNLGYTNIQTNELVETASSSIPPEQRAFSTRSAAYSNNDINSWIVEPQAEYKQVFGKGKLGVLIGASAQQNNSSGVELSALGFNSDAVLGNILAATNISVVSTTIATYKYFGAFGRIDYSYDEKYLIALTTRRDGSSRFGSANEFHDFGSIGGAWIFTKEEMITRSLPVLSFGKLKATYGSTGNDQIGDYKYLNLYNTVSVQVPYQGATGLAPNGLPNPYLQWEETKKIDLGVDLGFLRDRVVATFDYIRNRSSNQLLSYALPVIAGFRSINSNFPATVRNTSIEITLHFSTIKTKDFEWATSFNITIPSNKLVAFPDLANSSYADDLVIGQPFNIIKVYHFLSVNSGTGAYQVADVHGTPTANPDPLTDQHVLININPKYYGGLDNSFTYRGIQLSFLLQFTKQSGSNFRFGNALPGVFNTNEPVNVLARWRHPGDVSTIQKYNSDYTLFAPYANAENSDAGFSDASFIRFKNAALSYMLPVKLQRRMKVQNCRIYMQAQNLFTLTRYIGMDPETKSSGTLPPLKIVTFGLQLGL
jgi:TonB-dependent starch-binding outer membrane protein SusC